MQSKYFHEFANLLTFCTYGQVNVMRRGKINMTVLNERMSTVVLNHYGRVVSANPHLKKTGAAADGANQAFFDV